MPDSASKTLMSVLAIPVIALMTGCGGHSCGDCAGGDVFDIGSLSSAWVQEAYVKAPNAATGDQFGITVALNADTMVVGAFYEAGTSGAVYVFRRNGVTWAQEAYLKAPNAEAGDEFGYSVAIDGDTVVVGAPSESSDQTTITNGTGVIDNNNAPSAGAVYVFKRTGTNWALEAYLKAPNAEAYDGFGFSVAVSGDTVVVGAPDESSDLTSITNGAGVIDNNNASSAGAAYVFKRAGTTWTQKAYLKASNAEADDWFGSGVVIDGDTVVVGAPYESSNQTTITNGVGASGDNSAVSAGAAYVFKRTGTTWAQEAYLKASNADAGDEFGFSLAVNGDTVVVGGRSESSSQTAVSNGASASTDNFAASAGAAYVFKRTGATWAQEAYLKAPNAEAGDYFGSGVAVAGDIVVVGAPGESSGQRTITNGSDASADNSANAAGAVYVFTRSGSSWSPSAYLKAPNADANDDFGNAVSVDAATVVVGAYGESSNLTTIVNDATASDDNSASNSGAAYVFRYW